MPDEGRSRKHKPLGQSVTSLVIDFVIIQMDLFHMMSYQLAKNLSDPGDREVEKKRRSRGFVRRGSSLQHAQEQRPGPLERVQRLRKFAEIYHKLYVYSYLAEIARYFIIGLLASDSLQEYQLLDCFILARFRFFGRTNRISARVLIIFLLVYLLCRIILHDVRISPFKFYALEFLMYSHKEALREEIKFHSRSSPIDWRNSFDGGSTAPAAAAATCKSPGHCINLARNTHLNPVFFLRSPFALDDGMGHFKSARKSELNVWILRPNRRSECWRLLDLYTRCMVYGSLGALLVWFLMLYKTIGGAITSDLGFELSYTSCTSWLQRRQLLAHNSTGSAYGWIYSAPPVLAAQMDIDHIPAFIEFDLKQLHFRNTYHMARILIDVLYNIWWYSEFMLFACAISYLIFMSSLDVVLNASEIRRRLNEIVAKMAQLHEAQRVTRELMVALRELSDASFTVRHDETRVRRLTSARHGRKLGEQRALEELADEIATIQAVLADHFNLVRGYNKFVSFILTVILTTWCAYSILISVWMGSIRSKAVEFEFMFAEIISTFFALVFFSCAAIARCFNYRLYSLIARAMAFDDSNSATKLRWTNIIKLYSPKPKYCFTLLGYAEISFLFCLQFVWWILSAYIVLSKFFYVSRDRLELL